MERNWYANKMPDEIPYSEIEANSDKYHSWNYEAYDLMETGYESVEDTLRSYDNDTYQNASEERKKEIVDEVLAIYRKVGVYPNYYFSDLGVMDEIEKCIKYEAKFEGDTVSCVDGKTEFFTGTCWKPIKDYIEGDKVLEFRADGSAGIVDPIEYIHHENNQPFYCYKSPVMSSVLTGNHDTVYIDEHGVLSKTKHEHVVEFMENQGAFDYRIPINFFYSVGESVIQSDLMLKIALCLCFPRVIKKHKVILYIDSKKIDTFLDFISKNDIDVYISIDEDYDCGYEYEAEFKDNLLCSFFNFKTIPGYYFGLRKYLKDSFMSVISEFGVTKLYISDSYKSLKDFVQFIFVSSGKTAVIRERFVELLLDTNYGQYSLSSEDSCVSSMKSDTDKYCFVVPSHMLVLRRGGKVFITGNCGAGVGTALCNYMFPNLCNTPSLHDLKKKNASTMYERFYNDRFLKKAIRFCYSYKEGSPTPMAVMSGLRLVGSAPSNFRPMNAKAIYERFCTEGGTIYDPCCLPGETEFFDGRDWVPIESYKEGMKVLQYEEDGSTTLVDPLEYIHYKNHDPFIEYQFLDFQYCCTENHDVVLKNSSNGTLRKEKMEDLFGKATGDWVIPTTFTYNGNLNIKGVGMSDLYCLILASMCYKHEASEEGIVTLSIFGNKAQRENDITQIRYLLEDTAFISSGDNFIKFKSRAVASILLYKKIPSEFYDLTLLSRLSLVNFLTRTLKCSIGSGTTNFGKGCKKFAYFIQYLICSTGRASARVVRLPVGYSLSYYEGCNGKPLEREGTWSHKYGMDKYCFVVPSHMFVIRYKGSVSVTGNCGFGGRLLGALSSTKNFKYVGTDPCVETMYNLHRLGDAIEFVTGREDSYELHCCGSEVFRGKENSIDFVFTSPPYFNLEIYSSDETQCFNKFPELEDWLEGYVRQTIRNIQYMLKPGRFCAINIADFKVRGGGLVAFVDEWIRISTEENLPLYDTVYLGITARAGSRQFQFGEKKKENILIFRKPL